MQKKNTRKPKPVVRRRKPTNVTLDPMVKEEAEKYASDVERTNLSQLVNQLLLERLKAERRWPPSSGEMAANE